MKDYVIDKKVVNGIEVEGFILKNKSGTNQTVSLVDTIKLARSGKIENAHVILNTETAQYELVVDGGLSKLETIRNANDTHIELTCRILNSENKCIGYKAHGGNGNYYQLSIDRAWELASNNKIKNVKALAQNNIKILLGINGFTFNSLPIVKC